MIAEEFIRSLVISLVLTLIIEGIISFLLGVRKWQDFKVIILANVITNPLVVFVVSCSYVFFYFDRKIYYIFVLVFELFALFTEFIIFKKYLSFDRFHPFLISLINNGLSYTIGLILPFIF